MNAERKPIALDDLIEAAERTKDRLREAEQKRANDHSGPCPRCGEPSHVQLIETSSFIGPPSWLHGAASCDACHWTTDPRCTPRRQLVVATTYLENHTGMAWHHDGTRWVQVPYGNVSQDKPAGSA